MEQQETGIEIDIAFIILQLGICPEKDEKIKELLNKSNDKPN